MFQFEWNNKKESDFFLLRIILNIYTDFVLGGIKKCLHKNGL